MAEKKTKEPEVIEEKVYDPNELVEYTAPILYTDKERDIVVGVNGKLIRIKRGEPVMIQRKYLDVIKASERQKNAAWEAMETAKEQGRKALTNM